jgi:hypothetical protein
VLQETFRDAMIFVESLNDRLIDHVNVRWKATKVDPGLAVTTG